MSPHWSVEDLSALLDERLSPGRAAEARLHLAGCPECAARYEGLRRSVESLRALAKAAPPPEILHRVRRQAAALPVQPGLLDRIGAWWQPLALRPVFAAAFSLVLAAVLGVYGLNLYFGRRAAAPAAREAQPLEAYLRSGVPPGPTDALAKQNAAAQAAPRAEPPAALAPAQADLERRSETLRAELGKDAENGAIAGRRSDGGSAAGAVAANETGRQAAFGKSEREPAGRAAGSPMGELELPGGPAPEALAEAAKPAAPAGPVRTAAPAPAEPESEDVITVTAESPLLDERAARERDSDSQKQKSAAAVAPQPPAAPANAPLALAAKPAPPMASAPAENDGRRTLGGHVFERTPGGWCEEGLAGRAPFAHLAADSRAGRALLARRPELAALLVDGPVLLRDGGRVFELLPQPRP